MRSSGTAIARRTARVRGKVRRTQIAPITRDRGDDMRSGPRSHESPLHIVWVPALPALGERDGDLNEERRQQHPTEQAPVASGWPIDDESEHHCEGCAQKQDVDDGTKQLGPVHRRRGECTQSQADEKSKRPHCLARQPATPHEGRSQSSPDEEHVDERGRRRKQLRSTARALNDSVATTAAREPSGRGRPQRSCRSGDEHEPEGGLRVGIDQEPDRHGDSRHQGGSRESVDQHCLSRPGDGLVRGREKSRDRRDGICRRRSASSPPTARAEALPRVHPAGSEPLSGTVRTVEPGKRANSRGPP